MRLRWTRVLLSALVLASLAAATIFLRVKPDAPKSFEPEWSPWIGLPPDGMDATKWTTRQALLLASGIDGDARTHSSLAMQCGQPDSQIEERYVADIGNDAWGPFWRVTMDVAGSEVQVRIEEGMGGVPPPPPPPPSADAGAENSQPSNRTAIPDHFLMHKAALVGIRTAWADPYLWLAPQKDAFGCLDGNPVLLQACVKGIYAVRFRNCDGGAYVATRKLWTLLNGRFPAPKPARWE